ncbi:MAG: hypothetical protein HYV96_11790 [Opitutae bacterium]|nr:hypothetical protein [Opitutae bacterium]
MRSIAERYCSHHALAEPAFARHALLRALPLHARLVYPLLRLVPDFFAADLEFIRSVGRAHSLRDFAIDAADFQQHPHNARVTRRVLRLRVSSRKFRRQLSAALSATTGPAAPAQASL